MLIACRHSVFWALQQLEMATTSDCDSDSSDETSLDTAVVLCTSFFKEIRYSILRLATKTLH